LFYAGRTHKQDEKDFLVLGNTEDQAFGIFNAIAIIATTYGNGIIPEIQVSYVDTTSNYLIKE